MDSNDGDGVFYTADDDEAETRRRWRALVDREETVDRETGVAAQPGANGFLYRPGQFLSHVDDADRVGNLLDHCGVDPRPFPRRAGDPDGRVTEQVMRWRLPVNLPVPSALACLRTVRAGPRDDTVRISPNHVFFGCQGWVKFGPGGPPIPVSRPTFGDRDLLFPRDAGEGVHIAVMDTGIMRDAVAVHPIFAGQFAEPDPSERTVGDFDPLLGEDGNLLALEAGHGTFIAGIIATWAPGASVNHEASLHPNGTTDEVMLAEDMPDALAGADVVNLSLGGYTDGDRPPLALTAMLETVPPGVVVVAAAGNDRSNRPFWPAAMGTVLGVGAVQARPAGPPEPAPFTNHGDWVDCCAEGVDVVSTFPRGTHRTPEGDERTFDGMARWSGTSFAVARVAALVAAAVTIWRCENAKEAADRLLAAAPERVADLGPYLSPVLLRGR